MHTPAAIIRRYVDDDQFDSLIDVEVGDGEIDVHLSPSTDDVHTFSISPDQAWSLARALARAATVLEQEEDR